MFFSHFPVGWPLVLLAGDVVFGSPDGALALAALLAVLGTYALARELTRDHILSLVAGAVMLASPILAIQGGVYLGYMFTLGLGLLFATALLVGRAKGQALAARRGRRSARMDLPDPTVRRRALGASPSPATSCSFTGAEWRTAPAGRALGGGRTGTARRRRSSTTDRMTGSFTQFPNTAADPLDKFGFGKRRIMPSFGNGATTRCARP